MTISRVKLKKICINEHQTFVTSLSSSGSKNYNLIEAFAITDIPLEKVDNFFKTFHKQQHESIICTSHFLIHLENIKTLLSKTCCRYYEWNSHQHSSKIWYSDYLIFFSQILLRIDMLSWILNLIYTNWLAYIWAFFNS